MSYEEKQFDAVPLPDDLLDRVGVMVDKKSSLNQLPTDW